MLNNRDLIIRNVFLYNKDKHSAFDIHIEKGKIISVNISGQSPSNNNILDATGFIAIPGLIDMHIHGAGGADSLDGNKGAFETISRTLARLGTTSFLSAMVFKPGKNNIHIKAVSESTGKITGGAELIGAYLEGPFINTVKRGGIAEDCICMPSKKVLDEILELSGAALKIMCLAPEIPGNLELIRHLKNNNIIAAFGHSDANYEEIKKGFDEGINHVTHFFNAMRSLHHRDPGPIPAILENKMVSVEIIGDSHHVHSSVIRLISQLKEPSSIACISDGISATGLPEGIYIYNNREYRSQNGLARYLDGTFIGSAMSLANIFKNYMNFTNSGLKEAVDTVTINPARILGIDNRKGSIEAGKDADIVLLDKDLNVSKTIISGEVIK